jgi:hypothetical protein
MASGVRDAHVFLWDRRRQKLRAHPLLLEGPGKPNISELVHLTRFRVRAKPTMSPRPPSSPVGPASTLSSASTQSPSLHLRFHTCQDQDEAVRLPLPPQQCAYARAPHLRDSSPITERPCLR